MALCASCSARPLDISTSPASSPTSAPATAPAARSLFDPDRHMRVSEVLPGMVGYGLSVFSGTRIERFEVRVIAVVRNFSPRHDVVLIRCSGQNLEHTGSVAGMSGSPIFLRDQRGRDRLIGAFAYGWALSKDPIAGVQPIEYMLDIPAEALRPDASHAADGAGDSGQASWSPLSVMDRLATAQSAERAAGGSQLIGLGTPLMIGGASPQRVEKLWRRFLPGQWSFLQTGGGGGGAATTTLATTRATTGPANDNQPADEQPADVQPADAAAKPFAPGSVLAVPLLTGDMDITAIGTCTEVLGQRVWGFGHPFQGNGPVSLPMGDGRIYTIIANLASSFKLGAMGQTRGMLVSDQATGVAGRIGPGPKVMPIDLEVSYPDAPPRHYHFEAARDRMFTPLLFAVAIEGALTGERDLPHDHTLQYDLTIEFDNGKSLRLANTLVNTNANELFFAAGAPMVVAADNPFSSVLAKKVRGEFHIIAQQRLAQILSVQLPRQRYRPGQLVKAFCHYQQYRGAEGTVAVELALPQDLPDGNYQLLISDYNGFMAEERHLNGFRYTARSVNQVFDVLELSASFRRDAIYARLVRQADGVAVGRVALRHLPNSRRQVLADSGISDISPFVGSTVSITPTPMVMSGSAEFTLTVDRHAPLIER